MAEQVKKLAFYSSFDDITNPPHAELAAKVAELAPNHMNHVHHVNHVIHERGGSTA